MRSSLPILIVMLMIPAFVSPAHSQDGVTAETFDADVLEERIEELRSAAKFREALQLSEDMLSAALSVFDEDSIEVAHAHRWVGTLLRELERLDPAEKHLEVARSIYAEQMGETSADLALALNELGILYERQGQYDVALGFGERVLQIRSDVYGELHYLTAQAMNNLGVTHYYVGNYALAEQMFLRAIDIKEEVHPPGHFETTESINNLAAVYDKQGRHEDAEPLMRRILEIDRRTLEIDHTYIGTDENNLADTLVHLGRYEEAIGPAKEAIRIFLKNYGENHRYVADAYNTLGRVYSGMRSYPLAFQNYENAKRLYAKLFGEDSLYVSRSYNNIGELRRKSGDPENAIALMERALGIRKRVLGEQHSEVADVLANLGYAYLDMEKFADSLKNFKEALEILEHSSARTHLVLSSAGAGSEMVELATSQKTIEGFLQAAWALYSDATISEALKDELFSASFEVMQWLQISRAAQSISQMAARFATGSDRLSVLLRQRQDLASELQKVGRKLWRLRSKKASERDEQEARNLRARRVSIVSSIADIGERVEAEFENFASLTAIKPAGADIRRHIGSNEALVVILSPTEPSGDVFVWAVTDGDERWHRAQIKPEDVQWRVRALRCGLSFEEWQGIEEAARCASLIGVERVPDEDDVLPFDLTIAHSLYEDLLGPVQDVVKTKELLLVPSGALTSLPFHVLVTEQHEVAQPKTYNGYRDVVWLGHQRSITTLPSVASLRALRRDLTSSNAPMAYLGYGDPILAGGPSCERIIVPESCAPSPAAQPMVKRIPRSVGNSNIDEIFDEGIDELRLAEAVKQLCPLPDTAFELNCIGASFGDAGVDLRLGEEATELDIKTRKDLDQHRIVHFATHGLLAGDAQMMSRRHGEPALVMTPPISPDSHGDGLLTASEIAQLKFDADLVILSACNTAGGDELGAEALSGLARAFFYAGARSMVVSHWPVFSDAAVFLISNFIDEMRTSNGIGVSEALRRSMFALARSNPDAKSDTPHPSVWAPFVVVGEGDVAVR